VLDALKGLNMNVLVVETGNFREDVTTFLREYIRAYSLANPQDIKLLLKILDELYERPELFSKRSMHSSMNLAIGSSSLD